MANFCDAGDTVSGYIKCTVVTFYVKSKDSAGNVGKVVTEAALAQLKCMCVVGCTYVLAFESGERQLTLPGTLTVVIHCNYQFCQRNDTWWWSCRRVEIKGQGNFPTA